MEIWNPAIRKKKKYENQDVGLEAKSKVEVEQMCIYNCYYLYVIIIKFEHGEILYVQLVGVQFQISFFFFLSAYFLFMLILFIARFPTFSYA